MSYPLGNPDSISADCTWSSQVEAAEFEVSGAAGREEPPLVMRKMEAALAEPV